MGSSGSSTKGIDNPKQESDHNTTTYASQYCACWIRRVAVVHAEQDFDRILHYNLILRTDGEKMNLLATVTEQEHMENGNLGIILHSGVTGRLVVTRQPRTPDAFDDRSLTYEPVGEMDLRDVVRLGACVIGDDDSGKVRVEVEGIGVTGPVLSAKELASVRSRKGSERPWRQGVIILNTSDEFSPDQAALASVFGNAGCPVFEYGPPGSAREPSYLTMTNAIVEQDLSPLDGAGKRPSVHELPRDLNSFADYFVAYVLLFIFFVNHGLLRGFQGLPSGSLDGKGLVTFVRALFTQDSNVQVRAVGSFHCFGGSLASEVRAELDADPLPPGKVLIHLRITDERPGSQDVKAYALRSNRVIVDGKEPQTLCLIASRYLIRLVVLLRKEPILKILDQFCSGHGHHGELGYHARYDVFGDKRLLAEFTGEDFFGNPDGRWADLVVDSASDEFHGTLGWRELDELGSRSRANPGPRVGEEPHVPAGRVTNRMAWRYACYIAELVSQRRISWTLAEGLAQSEGPSLVKGIEDLREIFVSKFRDPSHCHLAAAALEALGRKMSEGGVAAMTEKMREIEFDASRFIGEVAVGYL